MKLRPSRQQSLSIISVFLPPLLTIYTNAVAPVFAFAPHLTTALPRQDMTSLIILSAADVLRQGGKKGH